MESLRFVALPPAAAHIFHNIATLGESLENKLSMSVETYKKRPDQFCFNTDKRGIYKKGLIRQERFQQFQVRVPTVDCPFTYFGFGANWERGSANTQGSTSRAQLTQIPKVQN